MKDALLFVTSAGSCLSLALHNQPHNQAGSRTRSPGFCFNRYQTCSPENKL